MWNSVVDQSDLPDFCCSQRDAPHFSPRVRKCLGSALLLTLALLDHLLLLLAIQIPPFKCLISWRLDLRFPGNYSWKLFSVISVLGQDMHSAHAQKQIRSGSSSLESWRFNEARPFSIPNASLPTTTTSPRHTESFTGFLAAFFVSPCPPPSSSFFLNWQAVCLVHHLLESRGTRRTLLRAAGADEDDSIPRLLRKALFPRQTPPQPWERGSWSFGPPALRHPASLSLSPAPLYQMACQAHMGTQGLDLM